MLQCLTENVTLMDLLRIILTLYLPHFESQYLVHLQILINIAQETLSCHI